MKTESSDAEIPLTKPRLENEDAKDNYILPDEIYFLILSAVEYDIVTIKMLCSTCKKFNSILHDPIFDYVSVYNSDLRKKITFRDHLVVSKILSKHRNVLCGLLVLNESEITMLLELLSMHKSPDDNIPRVKGASDRITFQVSGVRALSHLVIPRKFGTKFDSTLGLDRIVRYLKQTNQSSGLHKNNSKIMLFIDEKTSSYQAIMPELDDHIYGINVDSSIKCVSLSYAICKKVIPHTMFGRLKSCIPLLIINKTDHLRYHPDNYHCPLEFRQSDQAAKYMTWLVEKSKKYKADINLKISDGMRGNAHSKFSIRVDNIKLIVCISMCEIKPSTTNGLGQLVM